MSEHFSEGARGDGSAPDDQPTVDDVMDEQRRRDDLPDPSDDPRYQQVEEFRRERGDGPADDPERPDRP